MENTSDNQQPEQNTNTSKKTVKLLPMTTKLPILKRLAGNKTARIIVIVVAIVSLAGVGAWWGLSKTSFAKLGVDAALVEGTVQFRLSDQDAWEKVQEGMSFGEGAQVRTLENSRVVLNIDDGSAVRLNSESSVAFQKLTAKHIVVHNTGGDVYTRVVTSDERTFQVATGSTTYESLGTAYRTFNTEEKEGVEVYHSKVNILGVNQAGAVLVEQGERYYLVNAGAEDTEGKVTEIPPEELSKDEFVKWNSEQDKKDFKDQLGVLFDLEPPKLEVSTPANGFETKASKVEVKGTTEAGAKVLINGDSVENNDGQFLKEIKLNEGKNGITVEAVDGAGNKTVKNITVTRTTADDEPTTTFKLYGTKVDDGISFTWNISGISASKGFKLLLGKEANPTYSNNKNMVFVDASKRSYTWGIKDGGTYHFRICTYTGDGCSQYSNNITVTAPKKTSGEPPTGSIDNFTHTGNGDFTWEVNGGTALYGFKLVWSTSPGPTYPGSSANYYEKSATSGGIDPDSGNYYVRICMYYDGQCKNYSDEVYINL